MSRYRPRTLRDWVVVVFAAIALGLLPWAVWLGTTLRPDHTTHRWDVVWTGYDVGLALAFGLTAISAWRRSLWVGPFAATAGTLLLVDAWFDVILESHGNDLRMAIFEAVFAEIPVAALCYWIAYRTERFLARVVYVTRTGTELHVSATGKGSAEGHLVGIFEIPADGEPAREARDADPAA